MPSLRWEKLSADTWVLRDERGKVIGSVYEMKAGYRRFIAGAGFKETGCFKTRLGAMRAVRERLRVNKALTLIHNNKYLKEEKTG